ncbi:MAG TPA: cysteine synthase family protein [Thermoanaerobaculia bacterium]|nr:cysteine synthase family protein [Thermoanaerobaculia bacterium]
MVNLVAAIGRTPLLELERTAARVPGLRLFAKAEHLNPGGSVKDRPARAMILDGIERGLLTPARRVLDATSGNTGIADAMIGRALGFGVTLCVPANASRERRAILAAYGAELVLTDPLEGTDGAIRRAQVLAAERPDLYFYADQYSNPANWRSHFETTGPEIHEQTGGRLTHFVAGLGTSGTFVGVTRYLKQALPGVRCISVEPDGPLHGLEGMKHMATAIVPPIYDPELADATLTMATEEAYETCRRLAREEGVFVGPSAGASVAAALRVARELGGEPATIVTVLPDGGTRYLSDEFWGKA